MSPLSRHLKEYLALRRRLGFKLRDASYELHKFVRPRRVAEVFIGTFFGALVGCVFALFRGARAGSA